MTGKNWKDKEIIKILEFINKNFILWRDSRQNACAKAEKALKLGRDGKSIYNVVNNLLGAIKIPRRRKACRLLKKRKISGLVKEINEKTDKLNDGCKGKQKITTSNEQKTTSSSNTNVTTNFSSTSQAATTSTNQSQMNDSSQRIVSVIEGVHKENVKQAKAKYEEQIENSNRFKTDVINNLMLSGLIQ